MVTADFLIPLFFENTFSQLRFRFGVPALIFLALYCIILGQGVKYFDYTCFTKLDGEHISNLDVIPIAFFTASNDPKGIQHAREIGVVDYIKKPYDKDDLLNRIGKIFEKPVAA